MKNRCIFLVLLGCCLFAAILPANSAYAHHLLPGHRLSCSDDFPCPDAIKRRVDFWIQVFKGWGMESAIFHDPDKPERVYSVLNTGEGCGRGVRKEIKKERKRLKNLLNKVARKVESGSVMTSDDEQHIASLFSNTSSKRIRSAGDKIRCQSGVKDSFLSGLQRFNRYRYLVDTVLSQYNLPKDIRYLPFVESSYNPKAYSKAGAAGMWQIMPKTARNLGLELDATIDERLDPEAATHAAARYLTKSKKSITELANSIKPGIDDSEIYPFVITSYNFGLNGMRRAIRAIEPNYLKVIQEYKSPSFQVAVKNFYASFLAARHVAINSASYFGNVSQSDKLYYNTVVLQQPTSLDRIKKVFSVTESDLKPLNLGLTRFIWNGWRMLPAGYQLKLPFKSDGYRSEVSFMASLAPETAPTGAQEYVVRKGDTACAIARALRINCRELINVNQLGKRGLIRIGQKLLIPGNVSVVAEKVSKSPDTQAVSRTMQNTTTTSYKVKKGDSACLIAESFNVSCRELISANKLGRKATIVIGQKLTIPGQQDVQKNQTDQTQITGLDENNKYLVRKGDFACGIANRFGVNCNALKKLNKLNKRATIFPGQRLSIPGYVAQKTTETAKELAKLEIDVLSPNTSNSDLSNANAPVTQDNNPALVNLLDTLPDLGLSVSGNESNPVYRIWIEADETIGHYADWLGLGSTRKIRELNKISNNTNLRIGASLSLPVDSAETAARFEQKRVEYHQVLSELLKEHYTLNGIEKHKVVSGDSIWSLSIESGFPVWLLFRLNPQLKISTLKIGQLVLLPKLEPKG